MSVDEFDPAVCLLCGSREAESVLELRGRAMTSDSRVVEADLVKLRCTSCGLVRRGTGFGADALTSHYGDEYQHAADAAAAEPLYFTDAGPVPRSAAIFAWLNDGIAAADVGPPTSIMEIGAGEGSVLRRFADAHPEAAVSGIDMSEEASKLARDAGLDVRTGSYADTGGHFDLIYAVAVLEHVPSPEHFLATLGEHLTDDGVLLVGQPCMDSPSSEIFLLDHLHHFCSDHVGAFAERGGLREAARKVSDEPLTSFSLHALRRGEPGGGEPDPDRCGPQLEAEIRRWSDSFAELDRWLEANPEVELAVWGLGQTYTMLRAYTGLGERAIAAGIEQNPDRFAAADPGFTVVEPQALTGLEPRPEALLFTFAPQPDQEELLRKLGITPLVVEATRRCTTS